MQCYVEVVSFSYSSLELLGIYGDKRQYDCSYFLMFSTETAINMYS